MNSIIADIVGTNVAQKKMFTAFEISLAVQKELKNKKLFDYSIHRHQHLRDGIHNCIMQYVNSGVYCRNLQDVGAPISAYVYFPQGGDPSKYIPLTRTDSKASDPSTIVIPSFNKIAGNTEIGHEVDSRGTLCVTAELVKMAGLLPAEMAQVYINNNKIIISDYVPPNVELVAKYTVDKCNNVRINKGILNLIGGGKNFDFTLATTSPSSGTAFDSVIVSVTK